MAIDRCVHLNILPQCLCKLHHVSKSFGDDFLIKAVKVILHPLSLQSMTLFSYHHRLAMVAQILEKKCILNYA